MMYLYWASPFLLVVVLLATGRFSAVGAGLFAASGAAFVALTAAPVAVTASDVFMAAVKGAWLAWLVGAVILGGLFFRNVAAGGGSTPAAEPLPGLDRRARAFTACFMVGPFTEAATGFGVGQVAAIAMLSGIGLAPIHIVLLALFSQTLVPWGAMANGTMVGAVFAELPPAALGLHSALLSAPLLLGWLLVFWRMAARAGIEGKGADLLTEVLWMLGIAALLVLANRVFGPEVAAMAVLGPMVAFRFWREERPNRARWLSAVRVGLPYAVLIGCLAATRGFPAVAAWLGQAASVRPFGDGPAWAPLLHPGSWLVAVGVGTASASGRARVVAPAARAAWLQGRKAVLTIAVFLVAARIMADAGIAGALADALRGLLGPAAVVATPTLAGALGFLTGSSNAANGLLMSSQVSLAAASGVPAVWIAALQNTASAALTMLSPARVAMGCALVGRRDLEREVYRQAWPLGAVALAVLSVAAVILVARS